MIEKQCALCGGIARMYCESDQASLCWVCDGKVHRANFLVAKHIRCLLCSVCHSPTPWIASGVRLGPSVTICEPCLVRKNNNCVAARNQNLNQEINGVDRFKTEEDVAESYNDDEESDEDVEEEDEEEAENQVVPWDATAAGAQQSPVVSSSFSVSCDGDLVVKRKRLDLDLNCSYEEEIDDCEDSRPMKRLSRNETSLRSTAEMNSILGLHEKRKSNGCDASSSCV